MYNNNMNFEIPLLEEINRIETAITEGIGVITDIHFEGDEVGIVLMYKYRGTTFMVETLREYSDNFTTDETVRAAIEGLRKQLLDMLIRHILTVDFDD